MIKVLLGLASAVLVLGPEAALAHAGHGASHGDGFVHGFAHPLGGLDHILAMVTVGIFAYQLGGRAIWLVPSAFVLMMAGGGLVGASGIKVPFIELGIAASVIVLGAIVALSIRAPSAIVMGVVGLFAIFHGYAHGSEMPDASSAASYSGGFMLATALLHVAGIALGMLIGRIGASGSLMGYRLGGGLVALAGVVLLINV